VLHLRGEQEVPVAPLALPPAGSARQGIPALEQVTSSPAVALFLQRARDARPDFQLTDATAPIVAAICAQLDGLPLAIELAAVRVKLLPLPALLQRLGQQRQLVLLTGGARDLEERQQTMRAAIAWSEDLLTPEERTLFRRLAVFVGGCTLEAAEAVCAAPQGSTRLGVDLLDGLGALVEQSLVQQREEGGEARFGMLHVIREYALERLEAGGATGGAAGATDGHPEAAAVRDAHLAYYLAMGDQFLCAERATWSTLEIQGWFDRIEREHDNFRAALAWALARATDAHQPGGAPIGPEPYLEAGLRLAGDLLWFWSTRGHMAERREWLESFLALDVPDDGADPAESVARNREAVTVRARVLFGAASYKFGDYDDRTVPRLERSVALYRALGDRRGMTQPLRSLAVTAERHGDRARATALLEECVSLCREAFGPLGTMLPLTELGELALAAGDLDLAHARSEEALSLSLQAGELSLQAANLIVQALIARRRGLLERAAAQARRVVELFWPVGDVRTHAAGLEVCAIVLTASSRAVPAARLLGAAAAQRERLSMPQRIGDVPTPEDVEAGMAQTRAALGEEAWAAAFAAGRALSLEEAVAEALKVSARSATLPHVALGNIASRRK
jgi:non-specific serine/threonine protein kinase